MRSVKVSVRRLGGVKAMPWTAKVGGVNQSLEGIFANAGISATIDRVGKHDTQSAPNGIFGLNHLNKAVVVDPPAGWHMTVVLAPWIYFQRNGHPFEPLGVMFDFERFKPTDRQREGCAVATRRIQAEAKKRDMSFNALCMRTLAHEMGHTFNLLHQPSGAGTSVMHETVDLAARQLLSAHAAFRFTEADREWLTRGPAEAVRPGGSGFFGTNVTDRAGEASAATTGLKLRISTRHDNYLPGEPVFLRLDLANLWDRPRVLSRGPFAENGALTVEVRHAGGEPMFVRSRVLCCHLGAFAELSAGGRLRTNLPIHCNSRGLVLAGPGGYSVRVTYVDNVDGAGAHVVSDWHHLIVREPTPCESDAVATLMRSAEVAAGGFRPITGAAARRLLDALDRSRAMVHHVLACAASLARVVGARRSALELVEAVDEERLDIEQRLDLVILKANLRGDASRADGRRCVLFRLRELHAQLGCPSDTTEHYLDNICREWRSAAQRSHRKNGEPRVEDAT